MLGKVAQRYSSHGAKGNSLVTLSFPITKCALWDHTPTGSTVNVHLAYYRNVEIHIEKKVLQLAQRYAADNSGTNRYHCLLIGSVLSEIDGEGVKVLLDRFDPGRGNSVFGPTAMVPGDISIPCIMQERDENSTSQASVSDYITILKMLAHRCGTNDKVDLTNFFVLKCLSKYTARGSDVSLAMEFDFITMANSLKATPISSVPIMPTALSKNLMGPMNMSNLQGEPKMGYLTMDHTRKLLLILQSDPKVQTLPLVGIWVTGVRYVYDPYVWCSCLRYLHNNSIQEKVCTAPEAFLVALFSPLHSKPAFYECLTEDKTSRLKFELNTCQETVELTQSVQYRRDDCLVFDLQKVKNGAKMQAFTSATEALKQAIPEKDKPQKPLTEISVNIDDLMPRSSPLPHQTKAPVVHPQVPEVSLLFDDDGIKNRPTRMPLGYSVLKPRNDENSPVLNESNAHRSKSALQSQSSNIRAPLKTLNRDMNSKAKQSQNSRSNSRPSRENVSVEKTSTHQYSRRISLESVSKSEQGENTDNHDNVSPGSYFGVGSNGPFPLPASQSRVPSSHGVRMRSPNMAPPASHCGQYRMRYTSPPYMGPRQPYSDQYYHPGMQLHPGSTGSPPGMYPMPPRCGYHVRGQMPPRHPYGGYMPRPYPGQYGPRGPPVTGPGPYYSQSQGNRYPVPPYRPVQYRSSPPQPMNTFTSTSNTMGPPPRNVAQEFNPNPSTNCNMHSRIVSSATLALQTATTINVSSSNSGSIQTSPLRDNQPHGAIPPISPSAGDPSLPLSSPGSTTTNPEPKKADSGHEVNGVTVTPEVYKLLKQQDAQLKLLQAQLQKLLANQETKEQELEKPPVNCSGDSYQSILTKFQSTPSKKSCSIATNTSLFFSGPASPQRSRLGNRDAADVKVTDSCRGKQLCLGSETIVAEHQRNSMGATTDEDDDATNGTETSTNNNSFTFSMQMTTLQDGTMESSMSEMIVDLPCYDTGSGGDDPDSQDIQSVSMYSEKGPPPVMPCEMGDEQLVPGKEDNSREYYENLIGNIHDLLNKIPVTSNQGSLQNSVNSSLVEQEPVRDVAMATLEHLKNIGIYNEKDENDTCGINKTLINVETAVLHKINYVSMMFDDNSETDVSMEVNALAMKYLSDEQLSQMAKLSTNSCARRATCSSQNILQRVMHNQAVDQSSNVTLYGMAANNMSFATKKYMERYGLLDGKSGSDASLSLDGVDADDTCANMSVLNQEYLRVPPLAWHNMSLDEEPSKLEASDHAESRSSPVFVEKDEKFSAAQSNLFPFTSADDAPMFPDRFASIENQNSDYNRRDSLMSHRQASSSSSDCTSCSSYCEDSCTSGDFCPGCVIPRPRSDTLPLGTPRRVEKGRRRSDGVLPHDSCPDFRKAKALDSPRPMTRSFRVLPAANPDCDGQQANTTADSISTTDREVRKILEKPIGSFETDTVFSTEENQARDTNEDDDFRVFDRPAREMNREPLPQHAEFRVTSYSRREESICESILDIQRLKQLPKLL